MWLSSLRREPISLLLMAALGSVVPPLCAQSSASPGPQRSSAAAGEPAPLVLPDGTSVRVRMTKTISSKDAHVGDEVRFRVAEDVKAGELVVIARNANAVGHVAAVQKKRRKGRPGTLTLTIDCVDLITGRVAPLRSTNGVKGRGENIAGDAAELTLRTYGFGLPLTPLLLMLKGEDVTVSRGVPLTAYINGDISLSEDELRQVQPQAPIMTGPATVFIYRLPAAPLVSRPTMYCGTVKIGALAPGTYSKVRVEAGEYLFQSSGTKHKAKLHLEPGRTYYLRLSISVMFKGNLDEVSSVVGEDWVAVLDPSKEEAEVDLTSAASEQLRPTDKPKPATSNPVEEYHEPQR